MDSFISQLLKHGYYLITAFLLAIKKKRKNKARILRHFSFKLECDKIFEILNLSMNIFPYIPEIYNIIEINLKYCHTFFREF